MKRASRRPVATGAWIALALLGLAAALRAAGLDWGLPHTYNSDEPHVLNSAVALAPSLFRPVSFKYPTLWPTLLAFAYGAWFVAWSLFGLRRGVLDFAALYAFEPTGFYLIARGLSWLASLGVLLLVARAERDRDSARWPFGALALAFSPVLVQASSAAKPDSLMLLLGAGAWLCALRYQAGGKGGWLLGAGLLCGLSASAQYTAAPAALMVPLAALLRRGGPAPARLLFAALALAPAGFLLGTPYAALESGRFLADWQDYFALTRERPVEPAIRARTVALNIWTFGGEGSPYGAAALLGLAALLRRDPALAALLALPAAAHAALLARSADGGWLRYLFPVFPALALLASEGLARLSGGRAWRGAALAAACAAPALFLSARWARDIRRPDTRAQAEDWIRRHVPPGDVLLMDAPHASPRVLMSREQAEELALRNERAGSPRARLYRAMAERHPGGGWRVLRVRRSARDLFSAPGHVARSQAEGDYLDVRPGLDPARAVRVGWVITSSFGADPRKARELATFFSELAEQSELVKEFPREPGVSNGPWLRVYRLKGRFPRN